MNLYVINKEFEVIALVDVYKSCIWTDRYDEPGDFELTMNASAQAMSVFKQDYYILNDDSDRIMIVESITIDTSLEDGDLLIISGRSCESILDRRIVWKQITFSAKKSIHDVVKRLLTDAFMTKTDTERYVDRFKFIVNKDLEKTPTLQKDSTDTYGAQFTGDNILDVVTSLCEVYKLGFKITVDENWNFNFTMYAGTDRSYDNKENNPYVIFSPEFENIISSNYVESIKTLKTVTLVGGEGEGTARKTEVVKLKNYSNKGLERRELFTDARDISSQISDEDGQSKTLSSAEYKKLLKIRGAKDLVENKLTKAFEGEVETTQLYQFNKDYFLGDIVEVVDAYGNESKSRVVEIVYSYTNDGYTIYPTFEIEEDEEIE